MILSGSYRTTSQNERQAFAREREKGQERHRATARAANDNFRDVTREQETERTTASGRQERSQAANDNFQDVSQKQKPEQSKEEKRQQFKENQPPKQQESEKDRRIREAFENLKRDDFGLEHELE